MTKSNHGQQNTDEVSDLQTSNKSIAPNAFALIMEARLNGLRSHLPRPHFRCPPKTSPRLVTTDSFGAFLEI